MGNLFNAGYLRDLIQKMLCTIIPSRYVSDCPEVFHPTCFSPVAFLQLCKSHFTQGYAPLMSDFQHFYIRRLYYRIQVEFRQVIDCCETCY